MLSKRQDKHAPVYNKNPRTHNLPHYTEYGRRSDKCITMAPRHKDIISFYDNKFSKGRFMAQKTEVLGQNCSFFKRIQVTHPLLYNAWEQEE